MSQAGFFLYTGDWIKDTRVLTAAARGCWADALCFLNEHGGTVLWPITGFANSWSVSIESATEILDELKVTGVGNVEWQNDGKTIAKLSNRRILREFQQRIEIKEKRAEAGRKGAKSRWQNHDKNAVLPSPSLLISMNHKNDSPVGGPADESDLSVKDLVDSWNEVFKGRLPQVQWPLSTSRQRKARQRLKEHSSLDFWQRVFDNIGESKFLLGSGNGNWSCTLDFVIANDTNCVKIYEKSYK